MAVKIIQGQTLADLAMQELGSIEGIFALAQFNGMAVSDDLIAGSMLNCSIAPFSKQVLKIYQDNGYKPASGNTVPGQQPPTQLEGIDYWIIEQDFIVS